MTSTDRTNGKLAHFPLVEAGDTEAEGLVAIIRRLSVARALPEVIDIVTHAARRLLKADGITFVMRDGDLCHYVDEDAIGPLWKGRRFPMGACISGWCMEHGRAVVIPDIYQDDRIPQDAYRPTFVHSLMMAPVRQEEPVAALGAYWAKPRTATSSELQLLQTIANAAALAIAFVQLRQTRLPEVSSHESAPDLHPGRDSAERHGGHSHGSADRRRRPGLQAILTAEPPAALWRRVLIGLGFAALAWLARMAISPLVGDGVPFAPFFLAVLVCAIWGGRAAALTVAIVGGVVADLSFVPPFAELGDEAGLIWSLLSFWLISAVIIAIAEAMTGAMRREAFLNRRLEMVSHELQHRIKNIITIAQALAFQTGKTAIDVPDFKHRFGERLQALARAQELLVKGEGATTELSLLVDQILAPFGSGRRIEIAGGPVVRIDDQLAVAIALLINELATNATKYGALSVREGRVEIGWMIRQGRVWLTWSEHDGPEVKPPRKLGFGSRLLKTALPRARGAVHISYDPAGVRCEIEFEPV